MSDETDKTAQKVEITKAESAPSELSEAALGAVVGGDKAAAGRVNLSDFSVTMVADKATPK